MTGITEYKLTDEQKGFVKEMQDWYNGDIDAFLADLKDKLQHQYERPRKGKKMIRKYSVKMARTIESDLPKIKELKRIQEDLQQIDPQASLADLL
jgi:hypothetical protein